MDSTITQEQRHGSAQHSPRNPQWRRTWPAALGVLVAAGTAYGWAGGCAHRRCIRPGVRGGSGHRAASGGMGRVRRHLRVDHAGQVHRARRHSVDARAGRGIAGQWGSPPTAPGHGGRCRCRPPRCSCWARSRCSSSTLIRRSAVCWSPERSSATPPGTSTITAPDASWIIPSLSSAPCSTSSSRPSSRSSLSPNDHHQRTAAAVGTDRG